MNKKARYRILDVEGPTIDTSITGTGIINGIEVSDIVTYGVNHHHINPQFKKPFDAEGQF